MVAALVGEGGTEGQELLLWEDQAAVGAVRSAYRVPVAPGEGWLRVGEQDVPVLDVAASGLGVAVESVDGWEPGTRKEGAQLTLAGESFVLDLEVVHVSADVEDALRCGLTVRHAPQGYGDFVENFVAQRKTQLLHPEKI